MLGVDVVSKIRELGRVGYSPTEISRTLKVSYPTILKYLKKDYNHNSSSSVSFEGKVPESIKAFEEKIEKYVKSGITSSKKMQLLLQAHGYRGSYQALNTYLKRMREQVVVEKANSYYRVETLAGEQAQVDWGYFGKIEINGIAVNLYGFVYVLSYSRAIFAEFVTSQRQKTLQDCHIDAFRYLGGVPKKIRYDNMKTVVISRVREKEIEHINWNFEFKNFAQYFQFEPEVCPIYYPRSKGKVEAGVKFLKRNFFHGEVFKKTFHDLDEINGKLQNWLTNYANQRLHPTVPKTSVQSLWEQERKTLVSIENYSDFSNITPQIRRVSRISMVNYKRAAYWVPKAYIQHKIEIREVTRNGQVILEFYAKEGKIYEHLIAPAGSWMLPEDKDLIKIKGKQKEIEERLHNNPVYRTQVDVRDLSYYSQILKEHHG